MGSWVASILVPGEPLDCATKMIDLVKGPWISYNSTDPSEKEIDKIEWRRINDSFV